MNAELTGDLDQTLATMAPNPHLVNVPTMVGGQGASGVRTFSANRLTGQFFPQVFGFEAESQTHSEEPLVDERTISFTHTHKIDWMTGVEPNGNQAEAAFVVIVGIENGIENDKDACEHILGARPMCWSRSTTSTKGPRSSWVPPAKPA